jgi:hypothetical protein
LARIASFHFKGGILRWPTHLSIKRQHKEGLRFCLQYANEVECWGAASHPYVFAIDIYWVWGFWLSKILALELERPGADLPDSFIIRAIPTIPNRWMCLGKERQFAFCKSIRRNFFQILFPSK